jgi:hypothetical protein
MTSADPARVERLERQVAYLLQHLGTDPELAASEPSGFGGPPGSPLGSAADSFASPSSAPQPFDPQPFDPQPFNPQPYGAQPYGSRASAPQPFGGAPGVPAEPAYPPDLLAALDRGQMIVAIKIYRAWSGVSLREAKTAVEAIARRR